MANNQIFVQGSPITVIESDLVHPSHPDGLVNAGDPVLLGRIPGVALIDASATTDSIPVAVEGVFDLSVTTVHGLAKGETVHINASTALLGDNADSTDVPFGSALETIAGSSSDTINVRLMGPTPGDLGAGS